MDILDLVHDDQKSEDRPFQCKAKGCPKAFSRHARIHSNDRPFACPYKECKKTFIQRSALTVHLRVHTGERPHVCETCSKAFSDSSSLARHRRIHSGRRPYRCLVEGCGKSYCRKTTLTKHTRRNHAAVLRSSQNRAVTSSGPLAIASNSAPNLFSLPQSAPLQPSHSWPSQPGPMTHVASLSLDASSFARQPQHFALRQQTNLLRPQAPESIGMLSTSSIADDDRVSMKSESSLNGGGDTTHSSISQPFSPIDEANEEAHYFQPALSSAHLPPHIYDPSSVAAMHQHAYIAHSGSHLTPTIHNAHVPPPPMPYFSREKGSPYPNKFIPQIDVMPTSSFGPNSIHPAYHNSSHTMHAVPHQAYMHSTTNTSFSSPPPASSFDIDIQSFDNCMSAPATRHSTSSTVESSIPTYYHPASGMISNETKHGAGLGSDHATPTAATSSASL